MYRNDSTGKEFSSDSVAEYPVGRFLVENTSETMSGRHEPCFADSGKPLIFTPHYWNNQE